MSCTTKSLYQSIESCPGSKNNPGIRRRLYYAPKSWIAAFPKLPDTDDDKIEDMSAIAQLVGDFTLAADKFFNFIDLKDEASNVTFETVGEIGTQIFNNQANAIVVGMPDKVKAFARQVINDDLVYVYQDKAGKFCVIGNEMYHTDTKASGDTSAEPTGACSSTFAIQCYDVCPVPTYTGKLMISATQYIDCADGEIKTVQGG